MKLSKLSVLGLCAVLGVGVILVPRMIASTNAKSGAERSAKLNSAKIPTSVAELDTRISSFENPERPIVQDQIAALRMDSAYQIAKHEGYGAARKVFKQTVASYKGTQVRDESYGTIPDQAAYQAAVCLEADGKKAEAIAEYTAYLTQRPRSPLCHGVHRRLSKLDPKNQAKYDQMLQNCVTAREKFIREEMAMCGPKVIAYLAEQLKFEAAEFKGVPISELQRKIASKIGTSEEGTTLSQLQTGFRLFGIGSSGQLLNSIDFHKEQTPFVLLGDSHYQLVIEKDAESAVVYDPMTSSQKRMQLPKISDAEFSANILRLNFAPAQNRAIPIQLPTTARQNPEETR